MDAVQKKNIIQILENESKNKTQISLALKFLVGKKIYYINSRKHFKSQTIIFFLWIYFFYRQR